MTEAWKEQAACRDKPTSLFFQHWKAPYWQGRVICGRCPVRRQCLDYALEHRIDEGLFGGVPPEQRLAMQGRKKKRYA